MNRQGPTTRLLHTPFPLKDPHGSLNFPVYDSVAFETDTTEELEEAFAGEKQKRIYSRITNPTVEYFESKIRHLTGASAVAAMLFLHEPAGSDPQGHQSSGQQDADYSSPIHYFC
jgi:O-acetylhomoserine (thiol)-lyase